MALLNTISQKRVNQKNTYKRGERKSKVDQEQNREKDLKWVKKWQSLPRETMSTQHRPVLADICLLGRKEAPIQGIKSIKWGNSNKEGMNKMYEDFEMIKRNKFETVA